MKKPYQVEQKNGKTYRFYIEEDLLFRRTPPPRKLNSGEWVVLGCIVSEPCRGLVDEKEQVIEAHCECCSGERETDSCWGIVVKNSEKAIRELIGEVI